jgi:hypothetical protein
MPATNLTTNSNEGQAENNKCLAGTALESINELAQTIQDYLWESDIKLEPRHDSVLSALLGQVKTECKEGSAEL